MDTNTRRTLIGLACMAVGMVFIPIGDSIAKYLSNITPYSPGFLAWSRFMVGSVMILPVALLMRGFNGLPPFFYLQQAVRAALIASTITLIITAVSLSPVAEAFGAFFIGPALSVVFSVWFLKERASLLEWLSVALGFVGVLLVLQPRGEISEGLLWAAAAGVCYGGFLVATRWAARSGPPIAQLAVQLVLGFLFLLPIAVRDLMDTGLVAPLPLLAMGMTSAAANYLSIMGLARASAAFLAPVIYLQLVAATVIGLFFFNENINPMAACGIVLIMLTGLLKIPLPKRSDSLP